MFGRWRSKHWFTNLGLSFHFLTPAVLVLECFLHLTLALVRRIMASLFFSPARHPPLKAICFPTRVRAHGLGGALRDRRALAAPFLSLRSLSSYSYSFYFSVLFTRSAEEYRLRFGALMPKYSPTRLGQSAPQRPKCRLDLSTHTYQYWVLVLLNI